MDANRRFFPDDSVELQLYDPDQEVPDLPRRSTGLVQSSSSQKPIPKMSQKKRKPVRNLKNLLGTGDWRDDVKKLSPRSSPSTARTVKPVNAAAFQLAIENKEEDSIRNLMFRSVKSGQLELIKQGLAAGFNVDTISPNVDATLLMYSALFGNAGIFKYLIGEKASVDIVNEDKKSLLCYAAEGGSLSIIQIIVENYSPDLKAGPRSSRRPPFMLACKNGHLEAARYLYSIDKSLASIPDTDGITPLMLAASLNRSTVVEFLVSDCKVNMNAVSHSGNTALTLACMNKHFTVAAFLLDHDSIDISQVDKETGETLLIRQIRQNNPPIVRALIEKKANVEAEDHEGATALIYAARKEDVRMCLYLIHEARANFNHADKTGKQAMDYIIQHNLHAVVAYLFAAHHKLMPRKQFLRYLSTSTFSQSDLSSPNFAEALEMGVLDNPSSTFSCIRLVSALELLGRRNPSYRNDCNILKHRFNSIARGLFSNLPNQDLLASCVLDYTDPEKGKAVHPINVLDMALATDNIEFVTDPRIDRIVDSWWKGTLLRYQNRICFGMTDPAHLFRIPRNRYLLEAGFYILYLILFSWLVLLNKDIDSPLHALDHIIASFAFGTACKELAEYRAEGATYFDEGWNYIDITSCGVQLAIYALRLIQPPGETLEILYVALVAVACILMYSRVLFLFTFDEGIGPLLVSLSKMRVDIARFIMLQAIFLAGFWFALTFIIESEVDNATSPSIFRPSNFASLQTSAFLLLQSVFAGETILDFDGLTHSRVILCQVVASIYLLLAGVVLINLLIATMANTYGAVRDQSDSEFLFQRIHNRRRYDQGPQTLPAPLNLLTFLLLAIYFPLYVLFPNLRPTSPRCHYCFTVMNWTPQQFSHHIDQSEAWRGKRAYKWIPATWIEKRQICTCGRTANVIRGMSFAQAYVSTKIFTFLVWVPFIMPVQFLQNAFETKQNRVRGKKGKKTNIIYAEDMHARSKKSTFWDEVFKRK